MTEKIYLDDTELSEIATLNGYAEDKAREATIARRAVTLCVLHCVAKRGLDLTKNYQVTPRGELIAVKLGAQAPVPDAEGEEAPANRAERRRAKK